MKYIALLRGINVGGKNLISMKELADLFTEGGFTGVSTYINSGNIIFSSDITDTQLIKSRCEALISAKFGLSISLAIVSSDEIKEIINHAPEWWGADKDSKHNAIFVIPPITTEDVIKEVGEAKPEYERVAHYGKVIFWSAPIKTFTKTRWSKIVEKKSVYNFITIRNSNTVVKLAQLCENK